MAVKPTDVAIMTVKPTVVAPVLDTTWKTGDATLISADNILFRIPSSCLSAASRVLRDTPRRPGASLWIRFTDPEIESAAVLRAFLPLIVQHSVTLDGKPFKSVETSLQHLVESLSRLVRFLLKYSCDTHRQVLNNWVHAESLHQKEKRGWIGFVLGAIQSDNAMCAHAIRSAMDSIWMDNLDEDDEDEYSPWFGAHEGPVLKPCATPLWVWKITPQVHLWALARALMPVELYWNGPPEDHVTRFLKFMEASGDPEVGVDHGYDDLSD